MAQYQLHYTEKLIIQHLADGSQRQIPVSEDNGDYLAYLAWVAAGNTPDPADPASPPDPQEVADNDLLDGMKADYQQLKAGLNAIEATTASLTQHATTLSNITLTGLTLAQLETQLQQTLRALGTDLGTMIDNTDKLARGMERMLSATAIFVRHSRPGA